jgi:hypothetical protein
MLPAGLFGQPPPARCDLDRDVDQQAGRPAGQVGAGPRPGSSGRCGKSGSSPATTRMSRQTEADQPADLGISRADRSASAAGPPSGQPSRPWS